MKGKLLFLGTGASMGIPKIGCSCSVCHSSSKYNHRLRPSALIRLNNQSILIDVGPDFRQQALLYQIDHIDGIMLTHVHYDHIAGIDELRAFFIRQKEKIPFLLSQESFEDLKIRYYYFFTPSKKAAAIKPLLDFYLLEKESGIVEFLNFKVEYMSYTQANMTINGYRLGSCAYVSDIKEYPEDIFERLKNLDHLVLSALRPNQSPVHFNIEEAVNFAEKTKAKNVWFTHIDHELDHEKTNKELPQHMKLAHDNLEIEFSYDETK